ncbi:MAG: ABC transporter substrate-binding protein [Beijerinckiaceae bacterium]
MSRLLRHAVCVLAALSGYVVAAQAETSNVRIARQWGLAWMPFVLMERDKLIEKHAAAAGMQIGTEWRTFAGGSPMNDALLSGGLDYATTGIPGFLTLWDKAKSALPVKAVSGFGSIPFALITRNPDVKTLADFTSNDRIAVPSVKISGQAVLLQMAAERFFGAGEFAKLDPLTVTRSNPDGLAALLQPNGELDSQFSSPPYLQIALKSPGIHIVMTTRDIFETPFSNGLLYTTQKFHDANPHVYALVLDALKEAIDAINADRRTAVEQYLEVTKEKVSVEQMLEALADPLVDFSVTPHNVYPIAIFMQRTGTIRSKPESWKDLFFAEVHGLPGS